VVIKIGKDKRVTIYDIAEKIGASPSTVSRVLGNIDYPVSLELRERVLEAAKTMNYHPNLIARNLKKRNSRNIGIIIPSIDNPFYPSVIRGIEDAAYAEDYTFTLCSCDNIDGREETYFKQLTENNVSGIITIFTQPQMASLKSYMKLGGVVLTVHGEKPINKDFISFCFDHQQQAYDATTHLIEYGHRKIAFFIAPLINSIRRLKIEGYKKALAAAGIEFDLRYCYFQEKESSLNYYDNSLESQGGYELAQRMLKDTPEVTGIICMNDMMALGCISGLKESGYSVPQDYSVVGFDDLFFSNLISPKITTVRLEKYKLGQMAVKTIIEAIEKGCEAKQYDLSKYAYLVVRESSGKPR